MRHPRMRAIRALIWREVGISAGRVPGGYLWAIAEPAAGIFLLAFLFSFAFQTPPLGESFPLFYATGLVPFLFYSEVTARVAQAVPFNGPLLIYPELSAYDAILARFLLNAATFLLVGAMIFGALALAVVPDMVLRPLPLMAGYGAAAALALGVGTFNGALIARWPVWRSVWSILNRPLYLVSCIFFDFTSVPEPYAAVLWWNPLIHVIGAVRLAAYPAHPAPYVSVAYVLVVSAVLCGVGLALMRRQRRDGAHG